MASVEDGIAAQIRNIEARYGRPLPEWFGIMATRRAAAMIEGQLPPGLRGFRSTMRRGPGWA
jgi:hypothetical protein